MAEMLHAITACYHTVISYPTSKLMFLHYLVKHEYRPRKLFFSVMLDTNLENDTALVCYIFDTHKPISIIFCRQ